jgi:repressor LexA
VKNLTPRQKEVLSFIKSYVKDHSYPPTIREIAEEFDISTKGAYDHVKALEKKGAIACDAKRSRAIEIIDSEDKIAFVPLLGKVAAGDPIFAEENYEYHLAVSSGMVKQGKKCFALRVSGESMINAGILDGDIAVFCEQNLAENGEIVLAMIHENFTLKRFFNEGNRMRFQPENDSLKPIYTSDARIFGKLIGIIRNYG